MLRHVVTRALRSLVLLAILAAPCRAQAPLVQGDYRHEALRLESHARVVTWEESGVRTFVAERAAVLRQGPMRLAAPRVVVWFDRALSARPGVMAAQVTVYAEGTRGAPVRLVEGKDVRECGALFMRLSSRLGFTWECPLARSEKAVDSRLLAAAQEATRGLTEDTVWPQAPVVVPRRPLEAVTQLLKGDQVQAFWNERPISVVYMGDVRGTYQNLELRADLAVLWYDPDRDVVEVYGAGNVRVSRVGEEPEEAPTADAAVPAVGEILRFLRADEVYINPMAARGLATNPEVRVKDPRARADLVYVFRGQDAFLVDSQTLMVTKGEATTCEFARPHYVLAADRMQVVHLKPSTPLAAWNARLQVGEARRTLLWMPFLGTDLTNRAYLVTDYAIGSSSKFGTFVQTTWQPLDLTTKPPWVDSWTVNLDLYGRRGPAVGTEFRYAFKDGLRHEGRFRGYYINDDGHEDDTGRPVPLNRRGRAHWEHRTELSEDWRLDAEYYWLSDSGFLNEYFEADYEEEKQPESYLLARYLRGSAYLAALYKEQINEFLTDVEERPSGDAEVMGFPLGPFVYDVTAMAGRYDVEPSDELLPPPPDPPDLRRLHTDHRLSLPFSAGIFRFEPFGQLLGTHVTDSVSAPGVFGGSDSLAGAGGGATVSTTFSRPFGTESKLLGLNRLRHLLTPYIGAETLTVTGDSEDFIQMDQVDVLDKGTQAEFGLRQKLQTKRQRNGQWTSVDWVELDAAYVAQTSGSVDRSRDDDYARVDFEMQLTDRVSLHSRDNRIGFEGTPDMYNAGGSATFTPQWSAGLDYDRITDRNSTVTASLDYKLSDRYTLGLVEQYEFDAGGTGEDHNLQTGVVLRRVLHKWVLDVGLHIERSNDEVSFIVGFGPLGWGALKDPRRAAR